MESELSLDEQFRIFQIVSDLSYYWSIVSLLTKNKILR